MRPRRSFEPVPSFEPVRAERSARGAGAKSKHALVIAVVAVVALAGCGETLVDHNAPNLFLPEAVTTVIGACNTVDACGPACTPCADPAGLTTGGASAQRACLGAQPSTYCDYECKDGLLKCAEGCCQAARIAAGETHTCAIGGDGALYCWGSNARKQIAAAAPGVVKEPWKLYDGGATEVAPGVEHTCAVVAGSVSCWGVNDQGQAPSLLPSVTGAVQLAAGLAHTCARTGGGAVRCWGSNTLGQRGGAGSGTPAVATPVASGAVSISAGRDHTCAVLDTGAVKCWGSGSKGQLGDGRQADGSDPVPATSITAATAVAAGQDHACAVQPSDNRATVDPAVQCWGDLGEAFFLTSPQLVPAAPRRLVDRAMIEFDVSRIVTGRTHVCVHKSGDLVHCFGSDNSAGQLGDAITGEKVPVNGTAGTRGLAAGADHTCAIFIDGGIRCWGLNDRGQLGDGTTTTPAVGVHPSVSGRLSSP